ncbi:MAG: acid phosphatase, partial [Steroidobacteraceae bacterium]
MEVHDAVRALRDTPRWAFAATDADLKFPRAATVFACALGAPITEASMPNLYVLLQRTMVDAGQSTYAAKEKYRRPRPFAQLDEPLCVPEDVELLRRNGSYPSGHAAAGWAWALILAEIAPERTDALLQRGREFGQSRAICNVHWQSDVDTAQTIAAAVVARLHGNAEFRAQLERARKEVDRARRSAATAGVDCEAESRALEIYTAP